MKEVEQLLMTSLATSWDKGIFLEALHFDGVDDYVEVPYSQSLDFTNLTQLTVSFWIKSFISTDVSGVLVYRETNKGFSIEQTSGGKVRFFLRSPTYGDTYVTSTQTIADQEWHHIVATWNGEEQCIYIDGVLQDCVTRTSQIEEPGSSFPLVIGGYTYWFVSKFSNITVDELRIYKRGLTGDEVKALYLMSRFAHEFSYLSQINETVIYIKKKIDEEILPYLSSINQTVYENNELVIQINETTVDTKSYLVSKWGSLTAQELYEISNQTKTIANYINQTRWGSYVFADVMNKWGSYTASMLYEVANQTRLIASYINETRWGSYLASDLYEIANSTYWLASYINETRWGNYTASDLYQISDQILNLSKEINESMESAIKVTATTAHVWYVEQTLTIYATVEDFEGNLTEPDLILYRIIRASDGAWVSDGAMDRLDKGIYEARWTIPENQTTGMYLIEVEARKGSVVSIAHAPTRIATGGPYDVIVEIVYEPRYSDEPVIANVTVKNWGETNLDTKIIYWIEGTSVRKGKTVLIKSLETWSELVSLPVTSLQPGKVYYFFAQASANGVQPAEGFDMFVAPYASAGRVEPYKVVNQTIEGVGIEIEKRMPEIVGAVLILIILFLVVAFIARKRIKREEI